MQHHDTADTTTATDQPTCPTHKRRPGEPVWCQACHDRLPALLWTLADHRDALLAATGLTAPTTGRAGTRVHAPSPNPRFDHADEIDDVMSDWARAWLTHRGSSEVRGRTTGWSVRVLTDPRVGDVWTWDQSIAMAEAVRMLLGVARGLLGGTVTQEQVYVWLPAPCPDCGACSLAQEDGIGQVTCRRPTCDAAMTEDEYAGWATYLLATVAA